ncbi:hypothetical protein SCUP515_08054 [Seiridium cupressi]
MAASIKEESSASHDGASQLLLSPRSLFSSTGDDVKSIVLEIQGETLTVVLEPILVKYAGYFRRRLRSFPTGTTVSTIKTPWSFLEKDVLSTWLLLVHQQYYSGACDLTPKDSAEQCSSLESLVVLAKLHRLYKVYDRVADVMDHDFQKAVSKERLKVMSKRIAELEHQPKLSSQTTTIPTTLQTTTHKFGSTGPPAPASNVATAQTPAITNSTVPAATGGISSTNRCSFGQWFADTNTGTNTNTNTSSSPFRGWGAKTDTSTWTFGTRFSNTKTNTPSSPFGARLANTNINTTKSSES